MMRFLIFVAFVLVAVNAAALQKEYNSNINFDEQQEFQQLSKIFEQHPDYTVKEVAVEDNVKAVRGNLASEVKNYLDSHGIRNTMTIENALHRLARAAAPEEETVLQIEFAAPQQKREFFSFIRQFPKLVVYKQDFKYKNNAEMLVRLTVNFDDQSLPAVTNYLQGISLPFKIETVKFNFHETNRP